VNGHTYELRARADNGLIRGGTSPVVRFEIPLLGAVSKVSARSQRRDRVRIAATAVPFATSYRVSVATVRSCRAMPKASAFRQVAGDLRQPTVTVSTKARALWVQWSAVRAGVAGRVAPSSMTCTRVK
jgi:hypothetical protein